MTEPISTAIQDYLKSIYDLTTSGNPASTTDLAARLGIAPASVTGMVKKLAATAPPLVDYRKHQGVTLTPEGERAALEVIRHHRLLETYLYQVLGYEWDKVHDEACRLEHVISEDFEQRIAEALGHPERDPHGDPIPSADLVMPATDDVPLSRLRPGQHATIRRIQQASSDLLGYLDNLGLRPGTQIDILAYSPYDQNLSLRIAGEPQTHVLGQLITSQIFVEENL